MEDAGHFGTNILPSNLELVVEVHLPTKTDLWTYGLIELIL